jgi:dCTP deaminase
VLASQQILELIEAGMVDGGAGGVPEENIQPASLDLRLDDVAYRIRCSFLPGSSRVEDKLDGYLVDVLSISGRGAVLETNRPYLIPLKERLRLPAWMRAKANPKSSTGRLDVFTRLVTDSSYYFDLVDEGYSGPLYLEVVPLSFPIRVAEGLCLNQIRFAFGDSRLSPAELRELHEVSPLVFRDGEPVPAKEAFGEEGLLLSLDLARAEHVGYRAKESAPLLDMTAKAPLEPRPYWEEVRSDPDARLVLIPERFYLLMSREAVRIPPQLAAEMTAYDPASGELRTHYAGFFDPGFGFDVEGRVQGAKAALEVRAHDVPFEVSHGQTVSRLFFERMDEEPIVPYGAKAGSSYQGQNEALGKHFLALASDRHAS